MKTIKLTILVLFSFFTFVAKSQKLVVISESNECTYVYNDTSNIYVNKGSIYDFDLSKNVLNFYKNGEYQQSFIITKSKIKGDLTYITIDVPLNNGEKWKKNFIINKEGSTKSRPVLVVYDFYNGLTCESKYWDDLDVNF